MLLKSCSRCTEEFLAKTARATMCEMCLKKHLASNRHENGRQTPTFRAVDGEGIGNRYVLLGISTDNQLEDRGGLFDFDQIMRFLYEDFLLHRNAYYSGFYLDYDWNMWLKLLPRDRVGYLIDPELIAKRRRRTSPIPFPVRYQGWEFDWLVGKRFKLKPEGAQTPFMYICDTGPFFQTSLLKALHGRSPHSNVTDEMVAEIERGKSRRSNAKLDDEMRHYNKLENYALEELLKEVDHSLSVLGTPLGKTEYFGPGQAAQKWMLQQPGIEAANKNVRELPVAIYDALVASYYGGIFEITAHGHIPGTVFEYDINSAYPYQISKLPCTCGEWVRGTSLVVKDPKLVLVHGRFHGSDTWLGPLPFRETDRSIQRPLEGSGWYWDFEIAAAMRAGLLDSFEADEYVAYLGCDHGPLYGGIRHLYDQRLRVGKNSAIGKGCKLIYNSVYGKCAQSVGDPKASNAVNASLITAGTRAQIYDAIASHPEGTDALLMIATDAVYFTSAHPGLALSDKLGEWEEAKREGLCIFKPGMYWDDEARAAIRSGKPPVFKARGVSSRDFSKVLMQADDQFRAFAVSGTEWPWVEIPVAFAQASVRLAYHQTRGRKSMVQEWHYQERAGTVYTDQTFAHTSDPTSKRDTSRLIRGSMIRTYPYPGDPDRESIPYDARFGVPDDDFETDFYTMELPIDSAMHEALQLR